MENKKRKKWKLVVIGVCLFFFFLILGTCSGGLFSPFPCLYLSSFKGKVIDADTKETVSGAAVLAVYYKEWTSVAGSNSFEVDAQETLTDEKGEFKIPWAMRWFPLYRGYSEGQIIIFKPSYGVFPDYERAIAVGVSDTWPPPGKYIVYELPKLKTIKERKRNVIYDSDPYSEIPYEKRKLYIKTINEERRSLGLRLEPILNKER